MAMCYSSTKKNGRKKEILRYGIKCCRTATSTATEGRGKLLELIIRPPFLLVPFCFSGLGGELTIPSIHHIFKPLRLHGYGDQIREGLRVRTREVSSNENINSGF